MYTACAFVISFVTKKPNLVARNNPTLVAVAVYFDFQSKPSNRKYVIHKHNE